MKLLTKIIRVLNISIIILLVSTTAFAQKVETGIYEVIYDTDTAFVHQNTIKVNDPDPYNNIKYVYKYNYTNYIDKAHEIKYAVIIKTDDLLDKAHYNLDMVWLNKMIILNSDRSYSDNKKRKFIEYKIAIKNKIAANRISNENDYSTNNFFSKYRKVEYPDFHGDETGKYAENAFGINKNYFFIKSNIYNPVINSVKVDSSSYYNNPLVGSGYRKETQFITVNQAVVAFKPKNLKTYKNFLSIQTDSIKFYCDDKSSKILNEGDFICITQETDEWYLGDHISTDGEVTSGKIFIDDLVKSQLKSKEINGLNVKMKYTLYEEGCGGMEIGTIQGLKIYENNKLIQVIKNPGNITNTDQMYDFYDANFDGYDDLIFFEQSGGAGPNNTNNYYFFNLKTKQFIFNQAMSNLSQPEINFKTKTVHAAWRNGAANHGAETYKWINGKLTMVEYYETNYFSDDKFSEIHTYLINGKMRSKPKIKYYKIGRKRYK